MPKIVVKVNRSAHTRSKSQLNPKLEEDTEPVQPRKAYPKDTTPVKKTIKIEAQSGPRSKGRGGNGAEKRYFTVHEDNIVLQFYSQNQSSQTMVEIAESLVGKVNHTEESIRDRIRKVLVRLRTADQSLIAEEAKVAEL